MTYSPARIDLGSVVCNTGTPDANGVRWYCEIPEGWDSAEQRGGPFELTGKDGSGSPTPFVNGRQLVVPGLAVATSSAAAWDAYYQILGSLPGVRGEMDFTVHEPTPKFVTVGQHAQPRATPPRWHPQVKWTLSLRADYPHKRIVTPTTVPILAGTSETFSAGGNFAAEIEVELATSGTVVLTIGGLTLSTGVLPAGSVLRSIDRTIVDDTGADAFSVIVAGSQWPAVVPGSNTATQAGTADLTLTYYDTFA